MAIDAQTIKNTYSGYQSWNDPASIVADYAATGGAGKGATPYALGNPATPTTTGGTTTTGAVPINFQSLMERITAPNTGYQEAIKTEENRLPLIQQRYKALLDEIDLAEKEGTTATKQAEKAQISETQARAAAQGIFPGTVELGAEEVTRQNALQTILGLGEKATVAKAKALADQAAEEGDVSALIAKLKISQSGDETERYKTAIDFLLQKQNLDKVSGGEKNLAAVKATLARDAAKGVTSTDLVKLYAPQGVPLNDILNAYNTANYYGRPAEQSVDELSQLYNRYGLEPSGGGEIDALDRQAKAGVASSDEYKSGNMSDSDITMSILSAGSNPNDSFFQDLYANNPGKPKPKSPSAPKPSGKYPSTVPGMTGGSFTNWITSNFYPNYKQ